MLVFLKRCLFNNCEIVDTDLEDVVLKKTRNYYKSFVTDTNTGF